MKNFFAFIGISIWLAVIFVAGGFGLEQIKPLIHKSIVEKEQEIGGRIWQGFQPVGTFTATSTSSTLPTPTLVKDYSNLIYTIVANGTGTIKFAGTIYDTPIDPTQTSSSTNPWDYIEVVDLQNGTTIDGDTGVAFTGSETRMFEVNVNAQSWVTPVATSYTTGTILVFQAATSNE